MPIWFAAVVALAAITATYFFCVRPGLRSDCAPGNARAARRDAKTDADTDPELDRQLAELREEVRVLRAQDMLDSGGMPPRSGRGDA